MGSWSPRETQDGQDLLLHLLLLSSTKLPEAGGDHGLGLLAPQREGEQEQQGEEEQGPGVDGGRGSGAPRVHPCHLGEKAGEAVRDGRGHDCSLPPILLKVSPHK